MVSMFVFGFLCGIVVYGVGRAAYDAQHVST
jgi:hypothetical protein